MLRDDHAPGADKGIGPVRRRLVEQHANGEIVDLFDLDVLVAADGDGGGLRCPRIFPGEDDVVGGERLAVMPFDAAFQLPDHRAAVLGQPAIVLARNLGGQHRNQIAVAVPARQRLVKDPRAFLVLGSDGEMRVEQGDRLPIQQLQHAAAAGLGRLVRDRGLRHRHPGLAQHHARHRRGQADRDHPLDKGPPRQLTGFDIRNQVSQFPFLHGFGSLLVQNAWSSRLGPERLEMDQVSTTLSKQDPGQCWFRSATRCSGALNTSRERACEARHARACPGIHVLASACKKDVDGRDKPGYDEDEAQRPSSRRTDFSAAAGPNSPAASCPHIPAGRFRASAVPARPYRRSRRARRAGTET